LVFEGVETVKQQQWIAAEGGGLLQGYLFSRPLSVQQIREQYLRKIDD